MRTTLLLLPFAYLVAVGCSSTTSVPAPVAPPPTDAKELEASVRTFCGGACHGYAGPETFPRKHWKAEVERGFQFYEQSGLSLAPPKLGEVVKYFEDRAPEELPPAPVTYAARPLPCRFEKRGYPPPAGVRPVISHIALARFQTEAPLDVVACDMVGGRILRLRPSDANPTWQVLATTPNPAHAEELDLDGDGGLDILVANLGSFPPTNRRCGAVTWLRGSADGTFTPVTLLENVGRVADVQAADFRGVGKKDLIVAAFGLHTVGDIQYLENQTTDWNNPKFVARTIDTRRGAIHVPVTDLNGDGRPDFVAVIAQENEVVVAFVNKGDGTFEKKTIFAAPHPGYGSSGIQLIDLNADGRLDVLFSNGDILDEPYMLKPYHGVQWLENKGDLRFEHHAIAAMYGCHHARAGDLFGTGRPAIVAVSFLPHDKFPERQSKKLDAVAIFEQVAPGKFERHALLGTECDFVSCELGDLFGTGRPDLVIGNFSSPTTDHPVTVWKNLGK